MKLSEIELHDLTTGATAIMAAILFWKFVLSPM
jgi:hypothetical protein